MFQINNVCVATRENVTTDVCAQQRLKSARASSQSDQSLHCPHEKNNKDKQADLSLRWAHMSEGVAARPYVCKVLVLFFGFSSFFFFFFFCFVFLAFCGYLMDSYREYLNQIV